MSGDATCLWEEKLVLAPHSIHISTQHKEASYGPGWNSPYLCAPTPGSSGDNLGLVLYSTLQKNLFLLSLTVLKPPRTLTVLHILNKT